MNDVLNSIGASLERLSAAAGALEAAAAKLEQREEASSGQVQKITAAVETHSDMVRRELERKLVAAEQEIAALVERSASLQAASEQRAPAQGSSTAVRKTLPAATVQLLAKQGIDSMDSMDMGTLDAALNGLSIEQRLAVKSQLIRSGTLIS